MILGACSYQTDRLDVAEWHDAVPDARSLAEQVAALLTPAVTRPLPAGWQGVYGPDRAAGWIAERDAEGMTSLAVERASGSPVGLVLLHEEPASEGRRIDIRLGYLLAESAWGRGLGGELVEGMVRWARGHPDIEALVAGVAADNTASVRILERCGFVRYQSDVDGDELVYRLARS